MKPTNNPPPQRIISNIKEMKYIKKPVKIDAWHITQEMLDEIWEKKKQKEPGISAFGGKLFGADVWFFRERKDEYDKKEGWGNVIVKIKTLEGDMTLCGGNYLIKGIKKEFYPCKADIFKKTYKPLSPTSKELLTKR